MRRFARLSALLMLASLLLSCGGRDKIIPRGVMADIVAEMLLADEWLTDHSEEKSKADTSLFYDPILKRYGYSFDDWDRSVQHYLKDPEKFAKVFRNATNKLKDGRDDYRKLVERYSRIREFNDAIKGYKALDFDADTLLWRKPITDSLVLDSLHRAKLIQDSLDREAFVLDSLRLDSLMQDSIARAQHRRDSLLQHRIGDRKIRTLDF